MKAKAKPEIITPNPWEGETIVPLTAPDLELEKLPLPAFAKSRNKTWINLGHHSVRMTDDGLRVTWVHEWQEVWQFGQKKKKGNSKRGKR